MSRTKLVALNLGACAGAFALAVVFGFAGRGPLVRLTTVRHAREAELARQSTAPAPSTLVDGAGRPVTPREYRRIVSTSWVGDSLLLELAEPDRVLAFTTTSVRLGAHPHRFAGKPVVDGMGPLEPILALKPDIILVNSLSDPGRVARLREAGVEVYDVGGLHGLDSLIVAAERLGQMLGTPERGIALGRTLRERLARVAAPLGDRPRRRALYLSLVSTHLFGGTRGTSYHDVLTAAGLVDVAAERFSGWPEYPAEEVLALAPDLLVTKEGMGSTLCGHPGLAPMAACRLPGRIVELPTGLIDDPGPAMLEAAEELFRRVYGGPEVGRAPTAR